MITQDWDEELGMAQCIITDTSNGVTLTGYGRATCHNEDVKWKSEITGKYIATARAQIDILQKKRDYELKPSIMAIKHILSTMTHSKQYQPNSYEAKRIKKELLNLEIDLSLINKIIQDEKESLRIYLEQKDNLHNQDENK